MRCSHSRPTRGTRAFFICLPTARLVILRATQFPAMKLTILLIFFSVLARAADPMRPDAQLTPGEVANVTVEQITQPDYAKHARHVSASTKKQVFVAYFGHVPALPGQYEIDHLISLELGGSNDIKNLWPQNYLSLPFNAHIKDKLEDRMAALVRHELQQKGHAAATALLKQFQHEIATDWIAAYHKYVSSQP